MALAIPHITVKASVAQDEDAGEINSASIGFGLHQAWIFATLFGAVSVFGVQPTAAGVPSAVLAISLLVNLATLIGLGLFDQRLLPFITHRSNTVIAAALMCAGTLLVGMASEQMAHLGALSIAAGVLTGAGSAILLMFWGVAYSRLDTTSAIMNTAVAFVVAATIYAVMLVAPYPAGGVIAALIPWGEFALVWQHTPLPYTERRELPIFTRLPLKRRTFTLLLGLPMFFFGAALGFVRQVSTFRLLPAIEGPAQPALLVGAGLVASIVLAVGLNLMHSDRIDDLVRPILPVVALTFVFAPWAVMTHSVGASAVVVCGYFIFEALMWVIMAAFAQSYRISPVLIFGLGRGSLGLGAFVGLNANTLISGGETYSVYGSTGFTVFALACMVAGLALLPHVHDIRRAVSTSNIDEEEAASLMDRVNATADLVAVEQTVEQESGEGAAQDAPAAEAAPAHSDAAPASDDTAAEQHKGGIYRKKCESVANTYLLSNRESEVLFYLGRGFNAAYLEEKLFISEGTAKTHIRHIYGKTNVHSQQELMRLINDTRV